MKAYAKTDIGSKRSMNQDYMYCNTEPVGSFQICLKSWQMVWADIELETMHHVYV